MDRATGHEDRPALTYAERWALYVARHASGPYWSPLVLLAIAVAFVVMALSRGVPVMWSLVVMWVFLALLYWERSGFKRALARRDTEIERLRSRGSSV